MITTVDHTLGHKTNLTIFQMKGIIQVMFSGHNTIKLEVVHRKNKMPIKNSLVTK